MSSARDSKLLPPQFKPKPSPLDRQRRGTDLPPLLISMVLGFISSSAPVPKITRDRSIPLSKHYELKHQIEAKHRANEGWDCKDMMSMSLVCKMFRRMVWEKRFKSLKLKEEDVTSGEGWEKVMRIVTVQARKSIKTLELENLHITDPKALSSAWLFISTCPALKVLLSAPPLFSAHLPSPVSSFRMEHVYGLSIPAEIDLPNGTDLMKMFPKLNELRLRPETVDYSRMLAESIRMRVAERDVDQGKDDENGMKKSKTKDEMIKPEAANTATTEGKVQMDETKIKIKAEGLRMLRLELSKEKIDMEEQGGVDRCWELLDLGKLEFFTIEEHWDDEWTKTRNSVGSRWKDHITWIKDSSCVTVNILLPSPSSLASTLLSRPQGYKPKKYGSFYYGLTLREGQMLSAVKKLQNEHGDNLKWDSFAMVLRGPDGDALQMLEARKGGEYGGYDDDEMGDMDDEDEDGDGGGNGQGKDDWSLVDHDELMQDHKLSDLDEELGKECEKIKANKKE